MLGFNHSPHTTYDYLWMDGQTDGWTTFKIIQNNLTWTNMDGEHFSH